MLKTLKKNLVTLPDGVTAIIAGICLGIGFLFPPTAPLVVVGVVLNIRFILSNRPAKKIITLITLAWLIKYCFSLFYYWDTYPLDFMGVTSVPLNLLIIGFYFVTSSLWLSFGGGLFALLSILIHKNNKLPRILVYAGLPFFWVVGEWVAAISFSFFTLGPGSTIQDYFSFGMIGYQLTYVQGTLNLAQIYGIYGLTLIVVGVSTSIYFIVTEKKNAWWYVVLASMVLGFLGNNHTPIYDNKNISVYVIDTTYTANMYTSDGPNSPRINNLDVAVQTALKDKPDFIVLPEDSRYFMYKFAGLDNSQISNYYKFTHSDTKTVIIDSSRNDTDAGKTVLRANVLDGVSGKIFNFDKQYLVPQGEYVPYLYGSIMRLFGFGDLVDKVSIDSSYRIGQSADIEDIPSYMPGLLFCFESVQRNAVSNLQRKRPLPFVAHIISHDWFHNSWSIEWELDTMLQVQAVYTNTPIVSAANMAEGKLYLPTGEIQYGEVVSRSNLYTIKKFEF